MGIKIGNINIADINVGREDIKEVYAGSSLVWSKSVGNSYWMDANGDRHAFSPSNTPLINFCTDNLEIIINGQNVGKQELVSIVFDNDYFSNAESIESYFLYQCINLRTVIFPSTVSKLLTIGEHFLGLSGIATLDLTNFGSVNPLVIRDGFCEQCNELNLIVVASINYNNNWLVINEDTCLYHEDGTYPKFDLIGEYLGVGTFKLIFPERVEDDFDRQYSVPCDFTMVDDNVVTFDGASCPPALWAESPNTPKPNITVAGKNYRKKDIVSINFRERTYLSGSLPRYWLTHREKPLIGNAIGWNSLTSITQDDLVASYAIQSDSLSDYSNDVVMFPVLETIALAGCVLVGNNSFTDLPAISSLWLPNAITVGNNCFNKLNGTMTHLALPKLVSMGNGCFEDASPITYISLPELTSIGDRCFTHNDSLYGIDIPKIESIGSTCFQIIQHLDEIYMPHLTNLGTLCFWNAHELSSINIDSLTHIPSTCFLGLNKLTNFVATSLVDIGPNCFGFTGSGKNIQIHFDSPALNRVDDNSFGPWNDYNPTYPDDVVELYFPQTTPINFEGTSSIRLLPAPEGYKVHVKPVNYDAARVYFFRWTVIADA